MHSLDIIKCSPNRARWLPITRLSNSSSAKVVRNHMALSVGFPGEIIYFLHTWSTRGFALWQKLAAYMAPGGAAPSYCLS